MKTSDEDKANLPPYLQNNDWEEELNFKLWVTKGARFRADKRLLKLHALSTAATSFLSAYLIIVSLLPLFVSDIETVLPRNSIPLITTGISIILLVYTVFESAKDFKLRAHCFHQCALRISRLYNELRRTKLVDDKDRKQQAIKDISMRYDELLEAHENHEAIDYDIFQTQKPEYFKLSLPDIAFRHLRYYALVQLRYHVVIVGPPVILIWLFVVHGG